jgi:hypothetical protein
MGELAAPELIAAARGETGLEAFGGESFREGLEVLTAALEAEADLHAAGRQAARGRLLALLKNRLRIEDWLRRHPEIEEQEIAAPVFVVGLPRTGTTALATLLAQDPGARALRTWESAHPIPPPEEATQHSDPRIARVQAGIDATYAARPEMRTMYEASATGSTECQDLLGMEFRTWHFCGDWRVPSYDAWQRQCAMEPAYRFHHRTLALLQWRCPPTRWLLHAPVHLLSLEALDRVYPDARFVMTHRDPARAVTSAASLISFMRSLASKRRDPHELGRGQAELWVLALERALRFRERAGEARFADVHFRDLLADPVAAAERACERLGIAVTAAARARMRAWAEAHPRGRHGEHRYRPADFGLEAAELRARFASYRERFGVPIE